MEIDVEQCCCLCCRLDAEVCSCKHVLFRLKVECKESSSKEINVSTVLVVALCQSKSQRCRTLTCAVLLTYVNKINVQTGRWKDIFGRSRDVANAELVPYAAEINN